MKSREEIIASLKVTLDQERFDHTLRVEKIALALASKYRVNRAKTSLAALLHDCARRFDRRGLLRMAKIFKLTPDPVRLFEPKLFHGEIGRRLAAAEFGIKDKEILAAIENHTTGRPGMSRLEKIIYLADHIEVGRKFTGIGRIRKLALHDLDRAIIAFTENSVGYFLKLGLPFHPATVETRNYLLLKHAKKRN
ncbi:MAG: bis(5'-nucleosyl)-tetraphosphatase (symmetrical) YqeK [Candidatus Margulisbacteria bacterium]|nr:bis(5'-nucleosyl)-tetraphosphatase (symmetrical) YqeK [Candidatus Margulisiibacteriota bacterium]MBU1617250.1 bis(5'-nucleosyl)-tetraphosphatase (symmetrical) YqeK [Candidatus Margulisiibacteriota bacterium]MBU1867632.1 bis(5'-nucleosyl)-tetraphosphatase (symmetrical) YqeK [Candidatus Margulisiibacteriota bacterium]